MKKMISSLLCLFSISAFATIKIDGNAAKQMWSAVDLISKIENTSIIHTENSKSFFSIDDISCVFEIYNACSFYTDIAGNRKLIVSMEGSEKLMNEMAHAGIFVDTDATRMDATSISCTNEHDNYSCILEEYNP